MNYRDITVLIDMDDVLESLVGAWCEWLNSHYGTGVKEEEITDWSIGKFFPSLTTEEIFSPLRKEEFWDIVKPKDGAVEYTKKLIDEGFNVYICTASYYKNIRPKYEKCLHKNFPHIPWSKVIITENKGMINADILVDDGIHNLEHFRSKKVLMSAYHNRSYDAEKNGMERAENWIDVYNIIHSYADKIINEV